MKTLYFFISAVLTIVLCSVQINAQPQGFEQVFTFSNPSHGSTVLETNNGYVFGGYSPSDMYLLKTDFDGNYLWAKEFPLETTWTKNDLSNSVISSSDGGFLAVTTVKENGIPKIEMLKLDSTGNIEWQKVYGDSSNQFGNTIMKNSEGGYYIVGGMNPSLWYNYFTQAVLIKTDADGNEIWKTYISQQSMDNRGYSIKEFNDTTLVLGWDYGVILIDPDGEIRGQIQSLPGLKAVDILRDSIILTATTFKLRGYDRYGNLLWSRDFTHRINTFKMTNDYGFIFATTDLEKYYLVKMNSSRQVLWLKETNGFGNDILENSEHNLLIAGDYFSSFYDKHFFWILKTDSAGNYKYLSLISPFNNLCAGDTYNIRWLNEGTSQINIDYSTDNGSTWNNLVTSYPADEENFPWIVPYNLSDSCLLKITDSSDPLVYDMNDSLFSITANEDYNYIAINEIKMWIGNNGDGSHSPSSERQGFFWPGGKEATQGAVAGDGLLWGGMVNGELRIGGSSGLHGLQPGNILEDGSPADPNDPRFKVWKSRIDWELLPPGPEKDAYNFDYNNWPVDLGAPWVDEDGDGIYTPGIDHPKYIGDEVLFSVANDLDTSLTTALYGTLPIGLEMQCVVFGFNKTNTLKDAVFKKYKLINRSGVAINDMYFSYWADDDLGDKNDDFVGVDTLLNLGYTWNGYNNDPVYGTPPPAVGHLVVQPPIIPSSPSDSARYGDGWMKGYKNLPVTSFVLYINGSVVYADPDYGTNGATQLFNNMQGLVWDGEVFIDPWIYQATKFVVPGDPVSGTGWYNGDGWLGGPAPGDQRYLISSGPFNLAAGDTQEIAIAIFMAKGTDNVQGITELRNATEFIQNFYDGALVTDTKDKVESPSVYSLEQNYPNPFNPVTVIQYSLGKQTKVKLKIFDILGREVITLVNNIQNPGRHIIDFNASLLASGVYFYRIEAGDFIQTKKMILLK